VTHPLGLTAKEVAVNLIRKRPIDFRNLLASRKVSNMSSMSLTALRAERKRMIQRQRKEQFKRQWLVDSDDGGPVDIPGFDSVDLSDMPEEIPADELKSLTKGRGPLKRTRGKARFGGAVRYKKPVPTEFDLVEESLQQINKTHTRGLSSVIYVSHLPFYFQENQMHAYFSQFGKVKRVKLSRNYRTKRSRDYGFVEFASRKVALAVAHHHQMVHHSPDKVMTCRVVPLSELHPKTMHVNKHRLRSNLLALDAAKHNRLRTEEEKVSIEARHRDVHLRRLRTLEDIGVRYRFNDDDKVPAAIAPASATTPKRMMRRDHPAATGSYLAAPVPLATDELMMLDRSAEDDADGDGME